MVSDSDTDTDPDSDFPDTDVVYHHLMSATMDTDTDLAESVWRHVLPVLNVLPDHGQPDQRSADLYVNIAETIRAAIKSVLVNLKCDIQEHLDRHIAVRPVPPPCLSAWLAVWLCLSVVYLWLFMTGCMFMSE